MHNQQRFPSVLAFDALMLVGWVGHPARKKYSHSSVSGSP